MTLKWGQNIFALQAVEEIAFWALFCILFILFLFFYI